MFYSYCAACSVHIPFVFSVILLFHRHVIGSCPPKSSSILWSKWCNTFYASALRMPECVIISANNLDYRASSLKYIRGVCVLANFYCNERASAWDMSCSIHPRFVGDEDWVPLVNTKSWFAGGARHCGPIGDLCPLIHYFMFSAKDKHSLKVSCLQFYCKRMCISHNSKFRTHENHEKLHSK